MEGTKYIGMDVHKDSISIAVLNSSGKLVMESIIETKAITILEFVHGLRGSLHLTFEEGTWAAWLYDLLKPHVAKLVVCDPRRNGYLKQGSKSDRNDARKLAELLHSNMLRPVYHGEHGVRSLKELARSYLTITKDQARVMTRVKAVYRSWAIPCVGKQVNGQLHRSKKKQSIHGLNSNHNHDLKNIFKGASAVAAVKSGPFQRFYAAQISKGIRPEIARLSLARKIAAIILTVWKKGASFDASYLNPQTA